MADLPSTLNEPNNKKPTPSLSGEQTTPPSQPLSQSPPPKSEEEIQEEITSLGLTPPSGKSKKVKIAMGVLGLLFLVASVPVAVYLVKQRQEIRKKAAYPADCANRGGHAYCQTIGYSCCGFGTGDCYSSGECSPYSAVRCRDGSWVDDPSCGPTTPPPSGACEPSYKFEGATTPEYDCKKGGSAGVSMKACLPQTDASGNLCQPFNVTCSKTVAHCAGEDWANCEGACGASPSDCGFTLNAGECNTVSASCSPPGNCGSCQVDINGYGIRRWENSGCGVPPETPSPPTTPPITPPTTPPVTPPPTITPESIRCGYCTVYNQEWKAIEDLSTIAVGQIVYFSTTGYTGYAPGAEGSPGPIIKARFRINGAVDSNWCSGEGLSIVNNWCETTKTRLGWRCTGFAPAPVTCASPQFYVNYTIPSAGSYTIESEVYNTKLGWH